MRVLITGGSGFVGSHLLPLLELGLNKQDTELTCWSRAVHGDVLSGDDRNRVLEEVQPEAVIHLAWLRTGTSNYENEPENHAWAGQTVAFAREVVSRGSRFLGIGSMIENDLRVNSPYAKAKRNAAEGVLDAGRSADLSAWLRPSWIFDFVEPRPRVLRELAKSTLAGIPFTPRNPQVHCDFIHVRDVATAIRSALENESSGPFEVCSGQMTSVATLLSAYDSWRQDPSQDLLEQSNDLCQAEPSMNDPADKEGLVWEAGETARILCPYWAEHACNTPDLGQQ